ncbi:hypothetical protein IC582_030396 [Cucumis melo]
MSLSRSQKTKGIWLARCADIEPCTLMMDLEGTDGRERGEAANKSFLKTVFQAFPLIWLGVMVYYWKI